MIYSEVIIVGGGPAGSSCAKKLKEKDVECILLDSKKFPREKLCAGWITPKVYKILELDSYPYSITEMNEIGVSIFGFNKKYKKLQYAIRRIEFDDWLLKRSKVKVYTHKVIDIKQDKKGYIIDNKYRCKYLVGAGGTNCPVYKTFFKEISPRNEKLKAVAIEEEFSYKILDKTCRLWFLENKLEGYSWYVPKKEGYVNVGIGQIGSKGKIQDQWKYFIKRLEELSLVKNHKYKPKGYYYYVRENKTITQINNAFITGDAAGLATRDLAEGIGPAVESGILVADSIFKGTKYSVKSICKRSNTSLSGFGLELSYRFITFWNSFF